MVAPEKASFDGPFLEYEKRKRARDGMCSFLAVSAHPGGLQARGCLRFSGWDGAWQHGSLGAADACPARTFFSPARAAAAPSARDALPAYEPRVAAISLALRLLRALIAYLACPCESTPRETGSLSTSSCG